MNDLTFEWDENKSASNLRKHRVSFVEAQTVFSDELGRLMPDPDHSQGEERFILMGVSTKNRILVICHCEITSDIIRIISARKAEKFEIKQYEDYGHA